METETLVERMVQAECRVADAAGAVERRRAALQQLRQEGAATALAEIALATVENAHEIHILESERLRLQLQRVIDGSHQTLQRARRSDT